MSQAPFHNNRSTSGSYRLVIVTGPSGAGRSTAIHALEDLRYEVIDNLPLSLAPKLFEGPLLPHPIALGIDVRNRDFSASNLIELIDRLARDPAVSLEVLYIDCAPSTLVHRYNETRRRHPLAPTESPELGIMREIDLLGPIRARATHLINTTDLTVHNLKAEIKQRFAAQGVDQLSVSLQSFSYKRGIPYGLDLVFDCRFLRNPHWDEALRLLDGRSRAVSQYVQSDERYAEFHFKVKELLLFLLPAQKEEGKSYLAIGFGCTGGQHRSVTLVETMAQALAENGWPVSKRHRELERSALAQQAIMVHEIGV